eukprot:TRINITY_DN912_c0_g1_i1.p1 TRINITY_DN912_c0_g1~~TRINITY_DN912_c0_g1_i1.p1  ORF type:complete len:453 (+),score=210.56 TRINITY_DN912_c0_g1_i1:638-1996(+)
MEILQLLQQRTADHHLGGHPLSHSHAHGVSDDAFALHHDSDSNSEPDDYNEADDPFLFGKGGDETSPKMSCEIYYCRYCNTSWPAKHFRNRQQFGAHCSNCSRKRRVGDPPGVLAERADLDGTVYEPLAKRRKISSPVPSSSSSSSSSDGSCPSDNEDDHTHSRLSLPPHDDSEEVFDLNSPDSLRPKKRSRKQSRPSSSSVSPAFSSSSSSSFDFASPKEVPAFRLPSPSMSHSHSHSSPATSTRSLDYLSRSASNLFALSLASDSSALLMDQMDQSKRLLAEFEDRLTQKMDACRDSFRSKIQNTKIQVLSVLEQERVELSRALLIQQHLHHRQLLSLSDRVSHCERLLSSLSPSSSSSSESDLSEVKTALEEAKTSVEQESGTETPLSVEALESTMDSRKQQISSFLTSMEDDANSSIDSLNDDLVSSVQQAQERLSFAKALVPPSSLL